MTIELHSGDLPDSLSLGPLLAVDTETMGLNHGRDPLCVVQICAGDDTAHIVQLDRRTYDAPNLKGILSDPGNTKIFHYARFDLAVIKKYLGIECTPIYCTRTASRLIRTYSDKHGLRELCKELLDIDLNKQQQSSDWGADELSEEQLKYAAYDVLYLHKLKDKLSQMLERENRLELAHRCFEYIALRADLDLAGWEGVDIFSHQT